MALLLLPGTREARFYACLFIGVDIARLVMVFVLFAPRADEKRWHADDAHGAVPDEPPPAHWLTDDVAPTSQASQAFGGRAEPRALRPSVRLALPSALRNSAPLRPRGSRRARQRRVCASLRWAWTRSWRRRFTRCRWRRRCPLALHHTQRADPPLWVLKGSQWAAADCRETPLPASL